ncbi:MAG TPA: TolC family protein [Casimicrobiaceae bacterium]|nr:TolC family protein [Casimicrobiaceae bacterium]
MSGFAILIGLTLSSSPIALATDAPLTLAAAQQRAVERSRMLVARDAMVTASREMAVAAGQLPDPMLKLGVDNLPIDTADRFSLTRDFMTMRQIGIMQEFTRSAKRQARADRLEREADKSLAEKRATIAAIERDTALAWFDRYYAEQMAMIVGEQSSQARLEIDAAESAYRAGRGTQSDLIAARAALVALDDRASETRRRIRNAKIALARWVGDAAEAPLGQAPAIDSIRLDVRNLEADLAHHPQIAVLARQEDIALADIKLAQANKKSDWNVELMYSQRGPAFSNMVSLAVSIPLQWDQANRQDRELAAKLAMADQARAEREDMLRAHTAEVRAMIEEWDNSWERRRRYERELLPLATERTQATLAAYRGARASLVEVMTVRRNEIDVRLQALQLEMDSARLWAQLNFLVPDDAAGTHTSVNQSKDQP